MKQFLFICFLLIARSPILVFSQESNLVRNIGYNDMLTEYKDYIGKEFLYYKVFNYTTKMLMKIFKKVIKSIFRLSKRIQTQI